MTTKIEQINTGNISAGNDIEPINNQDIIQNSIPINQQGNIPR